MAKYLLEAPDALMDAWKDRAAREGVTFAAWLRAAASDRAAGVGDLAVTSDAPEATVTIASDLVRAAAKSSTKKARTSMCPHRVPPDRFCKRCDT